MLHNHSIPCSYVFSSLDLHTLCNYKGRHGRTNTHTHSYNTYKRHIVAVKSERTTFSSLFLIQCMWFMNPIKDTKYYLKRTNCCKEYWSYFFAGDYERFVCNFTFSYEAIQCCCGRKWCSFEVVIWLKLDFTAHTGLLNFGFSCFPMWNFYRFEMETLFIATMLLFSLLFMLSHCSDN